MRQADPGAEDFGGLIRMPICSITIAKQIEKTAHAI
jgi:hypothetical protein